MQKINEFQKEEQTLSTQSMPQIKEKYTNFGNNFSKNEKKSGKSVSFLRKSPSSTTQKPKSRGFFKIFAASGLALFMGIGTLCGVLIAPASSGSSLANQPENAVVSNEELAAEIKSYKADIAAGKIKYAPSALGLDPENDPVLWTTSTGLEVKQSNAISNPNLSKYLYVTMGTYSGYAINWLICGFPKVVGETTTPAGAAINAEISKNYYHTSPIAGTTGLYCDTSLAANNFRLVSECTLGTTTGMNLYQADCARSDWFTLPADCFWIKANYEDDSVYAKYTYQVTLTNYKNNNTLGLNSYINNGTITTNIYYLSTSQADLLLNKIAYAIGTTTATAWWNSAGYTKEQTYYSSGQYQYKYNVLKSCYSETGTLTNLLVGSYTDQYNTSTSDPWAKINSTASNVAGIRPGIVAKLL